MGETNGSLRLRPAAMVKTGSRQPRMDPITSILPMVGSIGSIERWRPSKNGNIKPQNKCTEVQRIRKQSNNLRYPNVWAPHCHPMRQ